jgi:formylglycine-generating enzyme required for sulfatase activity
VLLSDTYMESGKGGFMTNLRASIYGLMIPLLTLPALYFGSPAIAQKTISESGIEVGETNQAKGLPEEITNSIGMKFRLIEKGRFLMGASQGDADASESEKPSHKVKITKPFYIGVYEVTQAQYQAVMGKNPSHFKGPNHPVDSVSWKAAAKFCKKLSKREGVLYRLPTEAEWEYACRAGSKKQYYWGDTMDDGFLWYKYNSGNETHDVGGKTPNAWGLYDMSGNVWEWCRDWYDENYYGISPKRDPKGPPSGYARVLRGGCWDGYPWYVRSSQRGGLSPGINDDRYGFRVVREVK